MIPSLINETFFLASVRANFSYVALHKNTPSTTTSCSWQIISPLSSQIVCSAGHLGERNRSKVNYLCIPKCVLYSYLQWSAVSPFHLIRCKFLLLGFELYPCSALTSCSDEYCITFTVGFHSWPNCLQKDSWSHVRPKSKDYILITKLRFSWKKCYVLH